MTTKASTDRRQKAGRRNRGLWVVSFWALCIGTFGAGVLQHGHALLYSESKTLWYVTVPFLVFLAAPLYAWSRTAFVYISMPILALIAVEIGFDLNKKEHRKPKYKRVAGMEYQTRDSPASFGAIPNAWATTRRKVKSKVEWQVTYHFDSLGRRVTPLPPNSEPKKAALFLGGSRVYGSGLEDYETLPAAFARNHSEYRSYNYGFHRYGPSNALDVVRIRDLEAEIPEELDLAFYLTTNSDIRRTLGTLRTSEGECERCSNYEVDGSGAVVRNGDFSTGRPVRTVIYHLLRRSRIFKSLRIDIPSNIDTGDVERTAAVIGAIRDELEATFPGISFYVLISPNQWHSKMIAENAEALGVSVMDTYNLYSKTDPKMRLSKTDAHPSAFANETMARAVIGELNAGDGSE